MEGKFSLIFMADNGKTTRLRLGPAVLRSLVAFLALLPIVAGVSLWLNWKLYEDRRSVLSENALLRATVDSNAQTVARLSGLEQFLQQAAPEALGDLVAVSDVPPAPDMEAGVEAPPTAAPPPSASDAPVSNSVETELGANLPREATPPASTPMPTGDTATADVPPAEVAAPAAGSLAPAADIAPDSGAATPPAEAGPETPAKATASADNVDTGFARVENLVARRVGSRSLRISFDLFNAGQVPQLAGHTTFELITKDGQSIVLPAQGDTTYRINRLKKIVGNPSLPADIADTSDANVRVSIFADKELIFRVTTPLQQ